MIKSVIKIVLLVSTWLTVRQIKSREHLFSNLLKPWNDFLSLYQIIISTVDAVATPSPELIAESEKVVESNVIKSQLIDFFNQVLKRGNSDRNIYLEAFLNSPSQTIPFSALLQVWSMNSKESNANYRYHCLKWFLLTPWWNCFLCGIFSAR